MVKSEFEMLWTFLERFQPEVAGRADVTPSAELQSKLERLAAGECPEGEREELCQKLHENPALMRWLADQVKKKRANGAAQSAES